MIRELAKISYDENALYVKTSVETTLKNLESILKKARKMLKLEGSLNLFIPISKTEAVLVCKPANPEFSRGVVLMLIVSNLGITVNLTDYMERDLEEILKLPDAEFQYEKISAYSRAEDEISRKGKDKFLFIKQALIEEGFTDKNLIPIKSLSAIDRFIKNALKRKFNYRVCPICLKPVPLHAKASGKRLYCKKCKRKAEALKKRKQKNLYRIPDAKKFFNEYIPDENKKKKSLPKISETVYQIKRWFVKKHQGIIAYHMLLEYCKAIKKQDELNGFIKELKSLHNLAKDFIA